MGWITRVVLRLMQTGSLDAIKLSNDMRRITERPATGIKGVESLEIAGRKGFVIDLEEIDRNQRYLYVYVDITE